MRTVPFRRRPEPTGATSLGASPTTTIGRPAGADGAALTIADGGALTGTDGAVLTVTDLRVQASNSRTSSELLHGVSLAIPYGQMHGLVGETGSGKSMTAQSIMGLLPKGVRITGGSIMLDRRELVGLGDNELHALRGPALGMIFQNPRTALHPMYSVGKQMAAVLAAHRQLSKAARIERVTDYLSMVGIPDPKRIAQAYPHELSGGLAQRVVIATALICDPTFVIADEPTTGLDATVQRQILDLLTRLQDQLNLSVLMITHDLSIVAQYCSSVTVMYMGSVEEEGPVRAVLKHPERPYTRRLLDASRLDLSDERSKVPA